MVTTMLVVCPVLGWPLFMRGQLAMPQLCHICDSEPTVLMQVWSHPGLRSVSETEQSELARCSRGPQVRAPRHGFGIALDCMRLSGQACTVEAAAYRTVTRYEPNHIEGWVAFQIDVTEDRVQPDRSAGRTH
jgi:hypothetical protein